VTIALFEAAIFAVGWYALLVNVAALQTGRLPRRLGLLGVVFGDYSFWTESCQME